MIENQEFKSKFSQLYFRSKNCNFQNIIKILEKNYNSNRNLKSTNFESCFFSRGNIISNVW